MKGGRMEELDTSTFEFKLAYTLLRVMTEVAKLSEGGKVDPLLLTVAWSETIRSTFDMFGLKVPTQEDIKQVSLMLSANAAKGVN
jgi:hypothetical protein